MAFCYSDYMYMCVWGGHVHVLCMTLSSILIFTVDHDSITKCVCVCVCVFVLACVYMSVCVCYNVFLIVYMFVH